MNNEETTVAESFYQELTQHIRRGEEMSVRQIYSLFPYMHPKTVSWRLHKYMTQGKLFKTGHGYYSLDAVADHNAAGYSYMQKKSQTVFDAAVENGYDFYITGLDSLVGELLHVPESYPVLLVVEDAGVKELQNALSGEKLLTLTENQKNILKSPEIRNSIDVYILNGKDFSLSEEHIARKEKGFIDLYYAVTRLEYGVSVPELSRIYQNLQRNKALTMTVVKKAAKDRGIATEIGWLADMGKSTNKAREFMSHQLREMQ